MIPPRTQERVITSGPVATKPRAMLLLGLVVAGAIGCQQPRTAEHYYGTVAPLHDTQSLWLNNGSEPEWIDPGKCSDSAGGAVIDNIFAGLTQADPNTELPIPDIAESWEVTRDARTYTFHLRQSVWSDGTPLTAEDFAFAWRRVLDPNTASRYANMLYVLDNGEPVNLQALWVGPADTQVALDANVLSTALQASAPIDRLDVGRDPNGTAGFFAYVGGPTGQQQAATERLLLLHGTAHQDTRLVVRRPNLQWVGVRALDDRTLQVHLRDPVPFFVALTAYHTLMPVPRHVLSRLQSAGIDTDLWTRPEHIVSNGAYVLGAWQFKYAFTYEKNRRYWDAEHVAIAHVKALQIESANTALNMYRAGEIDWMGTNMPIPSEFIDALQSYRDVNREPMLSVYYFCFNLRAPPFDNLRVRQAFSLALDRASLTRYVLRGGELPYANIVPDTLPGFKPKLAALFDPNQARRLLAEAGFPGGRGLPPITFTYNTAEVHKQVAQAAQAMWKQHLGVEVMLENQEWKVFLENMELNNFQIARFSWVGDYPDPNTFLEELLATTSGNNHTGYHDVAFDHLLQAANRTVDKRERMALLAQAEARALAAQPYMPLFIYTRSTMLKPYVVGMNKSVLERHPLKYLSLTPKDL